MQCVICKHGQTYPGAVTVTLERDSCIVILKGVPAEVCENCGEYYLSESVTADVLQRAEVAVRNGTEMVTNSKLVNLSYEIELQKGEKLALPDEIINSIGAGQWRITITPVSNSDQMQPNRVHSAFLNGYAPEDEGLYDDYPTQ